MDEILENKTIKPPDEDRIDAFLLYELEHARSSLTSEREMANGMVNHFFTLVIASMGGFVYLVTEKGEQYIWVSMYVLFVGFILLVFGLSVIIRLIKRNFDGKIFQKGRKELYSTIKALHKQPLLCSYYQNIDKLNKEVAESPWFEKYMGVGVPIALVNCLLAAALCGYSYNVANTLSCFGFVFYSSAAAGGLFAAIFQAYIYLWKRHVVDSGIDRTEPKLNGMNVNQDSSNTGNQVESLGSGEVFTTPVVDSSGK